MCETRGLAQPLKTKSGVSNSASPSEHLRKAEAALSEVLQNGSDARKLALSLKHVHYSDQLVGELLSFSEKLEGAYAQLQGLLTKGDKDERKYAGILSTMNSKMDWFEKAKAPYSVFFFWRQ